MPAIVSLRNVVKRYTRGKQTVEVLHGINVEIEQGDFVALMGPSGSGKTTLLNLIGGLDRPSEGEVNVAGERIDQLSGSRLAHWRARHVGFVFQFYNLMPMLSAQRNVELPLLLTPLSASQRRSNAAAALAVVGLAERAKHRPSELSGGQAQRVAIARALAAEPDLLVLDEPTASLDVSTQAVVLNLLRDLAAARGLAYILITHDLASVSFLAHRVAVLKRGRIVEVREAQLRIGKEGQGRALAFLSFHHTICPSAANAAFASAMCPVAVGCRWSKNRYAFCALPVAFRWPLNGSS